MLLELGTKYRRVLVYLALVDAKKEMIPASRDREQFHRYLTHTARPRAKCWWTNSQSAFQHHDSASGPHNHLHLHCSIQDHNSYCMKGSYFYHPE